MAEHRLDLLKNFPFRRIDELLTGLAPGMAPIFMQIGEPQAAVPPQVEQTVSATSALFGKYPPPGGSPSYRDAVARWLERRYGLTNNSIDANSQVTALCGSREGLFQAALMAILRKRDRLGDASITPTVLVPNPMYHVYFGGAIVGGAEPVLVDTLAENNFVPNYAALPKDVLDRAAICYLCTPGNPTGAVATKAALTEMLALARKHDFVLAVDECYSEIWFDDPPAGGFDATQALGGPTDNLLVFNSLSKRSGAPGLRVGFAAGDPALIAPLLMLRSYGGAQVPGPLMAAGEVLWQDEHHVIANRSHYLNLVGIADNHLGKIEGFRRPEAGFFLWLNTKATVGDGETATRLLWQHAGIKVMPGRYMSQSDSKTGNSPGDDYIRIALVHDPKTVNEAMGRIAQVLTTHRINT
jgi:N-succinyldiaminopimelate aminotransferase